MAVVVVLHLVLHGGGVDGDAAGALLRGGDDLIVFFGGVIAEGGKVHGQGGGKDGLAMVHMADGADAHVGLLALEFAADGESAAWDGGGRRGAVEEGGGERG